MLCAEKVFWHIPPSATRNILYAFWKEITFCKFSLVISTSFGAFSLAKNCFIITDFRCADHSQRWGAIFLSSLDRFSAVFEISTHRSDRFPFLLEHLRCLDVCLVGHLNLWGFPISPRFRFQEGGGLLPVVLRCGLNANTPNMDFPDRSELHSGGVGRGKGVFKKRGKAFIAFCDLPCGFFWHLTLKNSVGLTDLCPSISPLLHLFFSLNF